MFILQLELPADSSSWIILALLVAGNTNYPFFTYERSKKKISIAVTENL